MKSSLLTPVTVSALALGITAPAQAQLGVDFSGHGPQVAVSVLSSGYEFKVNNPVTVVALGTFDLTQNGFAQPQQVGLWTLSGTLLASTYVNNSDPLQGFWRFNSITPVALMAGASYVVGSQGGEGYTFFTHGFTVDPDISYIQDRFHNLGNTNNNPLTFPERTDNFTVLQGGGIFGGNVEFGRAVPEPGACVLLGSLGLTAAGFRRRKRAR
jgi:hypothetical protein